MKLFHIVCVLVFAVMKWQHDAEAAVVKRAAEETKLGTELEGAAVVSAANTETKLPENSPQPHPHNGELHPANGSHRQLLSLNGNVPLQMSEQIGREIEREKEFETISETSNGLGNQIPGSGIYQGRQNQIPGLNQYPNGQMSGYNPYPGLSNQYLGSSLYGYQGQYPTNQYQGLLTNTYGVNPYNMQNLQPGSLQSSLIAGQECSQGETFTGQRCTPWSPTGAVGCPTNAYCRNTGACCVTAVLG